MPKFFENPSFPSYLKKREDFESLRNYQGADNSMEIFPHLNLSWWQIKQLYAKTGKPIGDLGASFSTLPVEGELQGVKVYPVDIMHMQGRDRYEGILEARMINARMGDAYAGKVVGLDANGSPFKITNSPLTGRDYGVKVYDAIEKAKANYIVADLEKIPVTDNFFSVTVLHDSLPKHSQDWDTFIQEQLPEILRVTDSAAHIYPMGIYKTEDRELIESDPLFDNFAVLEKITAIASSQGFNFSLRPGLLTGHRTLEKESEPRNGVFEKIRVTY